MTSAATTAPRTYSDAIKVAERLSGPDLAAALTAAKSFTVLKAHCPLRHARITGTADIFKSGAVGVVFDYCSNRTGCNHTDALIVTAVSYRIGHGVAFHLYNEDRVVALREA